MCRQKKLNDGWNEPRTNVGYACQHVASHFTPRAFHRPACALLLAALISGLTGCKRGSSEARTELLDMPGVEGILRISTFLDSVTNASPHLHRTTFVNNLQYAGMEDNDIRGFLDGTFKWGWNQPGQIHVRVGRRSGSPRYGEEELFRVLLRWADLQLPARTEIREARMRFWVESGPRSPLRILLYEVKKDWNPGDGGVLKNNVSPPTKGEVWWNDIGFEVEPWGLPGASFTSNSDAGADTASSPLAETCWHPGEATIELTSQALAEYVSQRINHNQPLLLLLKLSDYLEDQPDALITFFSGNHGDSGNETRRPLLDLVWQSSSEVHHADHSVRLEYGRSMTLPEFDLRGSTCMATSFFSEKESTAPSITFLGENRQQPSAWRPGGGIHQVSPEDDQIQIAVGAFSRPLTLGDTFTASLRDTWIRTAPPDEQTVRWTFVSPTGNKHLKKADYKGDWRWAIEFTPDETGPWTYFWEAHFAEEPFHSADGHFDVIADSLDQVTAFLGLLEEQITAAKQKGLNRKQRRRFMIILSRLERSGMQLLTPSAFRSETGHQLKEQLNQVRAVLDRKPPDPIPLVPDPGQDRAPSKPRADNPAVIPDKT